MYHQMRNNNKIIPIKFKEPIQTLASRGSHHSEKAEPKQTNEKQKTEKREKMVSSMVKCPAAAGSLLVFMY